MTTDEQTNEQTDGQNSRIAYTTVPCFVTLRLWFLNCVPFVAFDLLQAPAREMEGADRGPGLKCYAVHRDNLMYIRMSDENFERSTCRYSTKR